MNILKNILETQKNFQKSLGYDLESMNKKEKAAYIKDNILWSTDELHEMLHEIPFAKDWSKKYDSWSDEKFESQLQLSKEEYIDFLHFAFNIGLALGLTDEDIDRMFHEKNKINHTRQKVGY